MQLRIPGPTPIPEDVLRTQSRQMVDHRGKEFGALLQNTTARLKQIFQTKNDVFLLTGSGTGGMEAAVVNTLSPGDRVLSVSVGSFGNRFAGIAEQFGASVEHLQFEWGTPADPDAVRRALAKDSAFKAVLFTHNETSTGLTNDLAGLSQAAREAGVLIIVDAISSLGSIDLPVDRWGCDVVVTASQKGWMAPPGIAMVSVSEKAWAAHAKAKMPRFYWDFSKARSFVEKGQTPWTPAVSTAYALDLATEKMLAEGMSNIFARHARVGKAAREGAKSLGLALFASEAYASNTVTAVKGAEGMDVKKLVRTLREEHQVYIAAGQDKLEEKIFRIGHLGWVTEEDIQVVLSAVKVVLPQAGFKV
jgi:aspartate aminotransferase-like enzyme